MGPIDFLLFTLLSIAASDFVEKTSKVRPQNFVVGPYKLHFPSPWKVSPCPWEGMLLFTIDWSNSCHLGSCKMLLFGLNNARGHGPCCRHYHWWYRKVSCLSCECIWLLAFLLVCCNRLHALFETSILLALHVMYSTDFSMQFQASRDLNNVTMIKSKSDIVWKFLSN